MFFTVQITASDVNKIFNYPVKGNAMILADIDVQSSNQHYILSAL